MYPHGALSAFRVHSVLVLTQVFVKSVYPVKLLLLLGLLLVVHSVHRYIVGVKSIMKRSEEGKN